MNSRQLLRFRKKNNGFVLVSVLMLGVLLISCATAFTWFVRMQVRGVFRERDNITKRSMANVAVNAIAEILAETEQHYEYDSPTQRWFKPFVLTFGDELGIWVVQITPLDDKIPLRNLFLPDGNTLRHEFDQPLQDMLEKINHRELEFLLLDFIDKNNRPRVGGVERDEFINRPPFDMSELLILSPDITPEILYGTGTELGIEDYCTIYSDGKINLNFAPLHVMEILPGLRERSLAERLEQSRQETPLKNLRDVQSLPGASPRTSTLLTNIACFKSRYFNVKIECLNDGGEGGTSFNIIFDRSSKQIVRWEEM